MSAAEWVLLGMCLGAAVGFAVARYIFREQIELCQAEVVTNRSWVSSCCQWAALNTSREHPEVEITCKAIETAFHQGELPDADKLHLDLTRLKARR